MKVTTSSPRIEAYRRIALELIIADHGLDSTNYCFSCDKNGACELQAVCREHGVLESPYEVTQKREPVRDENPFLAHDRTCAFAASVAWAPATTPRATTRWEPRSAAFAR